MNYITHIHLNILKVLILRLILLSLHRPLICAKKTMRNIYETGQTLDWHGSRHSAKHLFQAWSAQALAWSEVFFLCCTVRMERCP